MIDKTAGSFSIGTTENQFTIMKRLCAVVIFALAAQTAAGCLNAKEEPVSEAPAAPPEAKDLQLATFGGGCFWCVEALLETLDGIESVVSGYAGGHKENPTYQEVCEETTGHAEVVQVAFDPKIISFEQLLTQFWQAHDPTTLNRQGNDVGTQYRSIILYHDEEQKAAAEKSKTAVAATLTDPVVTEIVPFKKFYRAEAYHQDYYRKNPNQGYCYFIIRPKLQEFLKDK